jgi:acetyl-CoA acetyltransferase
MNTEHSVQSITGQCHDFRQQGNAQARQRCLEKRLRRIGAEALSSQLKAVAAQRNGFFDAEITPVTIAQRKGDPIVVSKDEHPRETSLEALARLQGVVRPDGTVTAGNASGVNDGAAALLLASEAVAVRHGLTPRARVVGLATAGVEPRIMGIGPTPATQKVLDLTGLSLEQMDVIELNEAFAAQGLAVLRQLGLADDDPRVNPNGGAIALGHPLGASGAAGRHRGQRVAPRARTLRAVHHVHRCGTGPRRHPRAGVMRAACITGHGGNEVVCLGERPRPVRQAGEVLVRLSAATVNRVDLYMRDSGAGITHCR